MTDARFEKVGHSEAVLYGPRKLLLCGFPSGAQSKFRAVLKMIGFENVPKIWVGTEQSSQVLAELLTLDDETGSGASSTLPRAVVVAGITQSELLRLMTACKKTGMTNALWATLTPTSERWTVKQLLDELASERRAMQKRGRT